MTTDRFVLTALSLHDIPDIYAHFSQPEVTEFLDIAPLERPEHAAAIVHWAESLLRESRGVRWSIRERHTREFLGTCGFNTLIRQGGSRAE